LLAVPPASLGAILVKLALQAFMNGVVHYLEKESLDISITFAGNFSSTLD
jgi:hypothetical protein